MSMKKTAIAVGVAVGAGFAAVPQTASATILEFSWEGVFTMLDSNGAAFANESLTGKGVNKYQTPVSGTMSFDNVTNAGTATMDPIPFANATAEATSITMQAVGDGMGGAGTLVVANMGFNWNGNNGIPTSLVLDAAGFFTATDADFADGTLDNTDAAVIANGGTPASDGTYNGGIPGTFKYLQLGAVPISTTDWNLQNMPGCTPGADSNYENNIGGGCMNVAISGGIDVVADTTANPNRYDLGTPTYSDLLGDGTGIGGNPMVDGPFGGYNANFDILSLTATGTSEGTIGPFDVNANPVPVPAAVWLFGSGLIGLVGVARRKKTA